MKKIKIETLWNSEEDHRSEGKEPTLEKLTREDWVEIYYSVRDKYESGRAVSTDSKWKDHMKEILEKLGPDAENMNEED